MTPHDFWKIYTWETPPADLLARAGVDDCRAAAVHYVAQLPIVFGIVQRRGWRDSFIAEDQHTSEEVVAGIAAYLEETALAGGEAALPLDTDPAAVQSLEAGERGPENDLQSPGQPEFAPRPSPWQFRRVPVNTPLDQRPIEDTAHVIRRMHAPREELLINTPVDQEMQQAQVFTPTAAYAHAGYIETDAEELVEDDEITKTEKDATHDEQTEE